MVDFMDCCKEWIGGSPYSLLVENLHSENIDGVYEVEGERAEFLSSASAGDEVGGVKYEKVDNDGVHWTTEVVGCKSSDGNLFVAVQLSVDAEIPVEKLGKGRRPYIIKLLMQKFGGGFDGLLQVDDAPLFLKEDQQDLAADIICARTESVMPVVYVSRHSDGGLSVDPAQLAQWVSAMAHVVVEPSRTFSAELSREVFSENPYGGAVAIYWPDGVGRWLYLPDRWGEPGALQGAIARKIRGSLLFHRARRECTWNYLQELVSRDRFERIRSSGSGGVEDYVAHFDREMAERREEVRRLEAELNRIKFSKWNVESSSEQGLFTIELASPERDLYQGEQLSAVLDAIERAAESAEVNSRKRHVLESIFGANQREGEREMILPRLKEILNQYESMSGPVRKELEDLGFEVSQDGKHCKLTFRGDDRFPFILSKSSSDWRAGKNAFTDIRKKVF
ncbi:hypothetical protein ABE522_03290 [Stenotrophomonas pennii]|uniref:hypothetical protein n=1 Tax=Stenotrophomonas lacuserhaii TaxID=2760084 RepID=UPI003207D002